MNRKANGYQLKANGSALSNCHETRGPNVALFDSKELRLLPAQRFEYYAHSDIVGSGRHGAGAYQRRGQPLRLAFDGQPLGRTSYAQTRPNATASRPDSLTLTFQVWGAAGRDAPQPLEGATVLTRDTGGQVVQGASVDAAGRATLRLPRPPRPQGLRISAVGWQNLELPWPATDTAYDVWLQANFGTLHPAGSTLAFRILNERADRLVLQRGSDTTTLARRQPR